MYKCSVEIHRLSQNIFLEWMHLQHWATKLDTVKESLEKQTAELEAKKASASAAASCGTPQVPTAVTRKSHECMKRWVQLLAAAEFRKWEDDKHAAEATAA